MTALERRVSQVSEDPRGLYAEFFSRCALAGEHVLVEGAEREVSGTWAGLDPFLGLRVEDEDGARHLPVAHVRGVRPAP